MKKQKIGIIGGLGPQAGVEFCRLLIEEATKAGASAGEDFPEFVLHSLAIKDFFSVSDPQDLHQGELVLRRAAIGLKKDDVDLVVIACNTAHLFAKPVRKEFKKRFVSITEAVAEAVIQSGAKTVGLMASPTTIRLGLYDKVFANNHINVINPLREDILVLEEIIQAIIGGNLDRKKTRVAFSLVHRLQSRGAEKVILACTELRLVPGLVNLPKVLDSSLILARVLLQKQQQLDIIK